MLGEGKLDRARELDRRHRRDSEVREAGLEAGRRGGAPRTTTRPDEDDGAEEADADEPAAKPAQRAKVVLVDHDLTPTQQHNLETATGVDVLDRTAVIVEIFHRHAKTREARLQVEVARLRYLAPRLREAGGGGDRVRGGVGGKGAGESSLELDRRRIRDRIAELARRARRRSAAARRPGASGAASCRPSRSSATRTPASRR